mmetsp:Transcript_16073/g.48652  ORF Transcript_16073/g.48652 Transcript_16073/m.48652 type:complete len:350 (-) Transcript_16073:1093-2142(-)
MKWRSSRRRVGAWTESTRAVRWARAAAGSSPLSSSTSGRSLSRKVARLRMALWPAKAAKEGPPSVLGCLEASRQALTRKAREDSALSSQWLSKSTAWVALVVRRAEARARRQAKAPAARRQSSSSTASGTAKGAAARSAAREARAFWTVTAPAKARTTASAAVALRRARERRSVASQWRSRAARKGMGASRAAHWPRTRRSVDSATPAVACSSNASAGVTYGPDKGATNSSSSPSSAVSGSTLKGVRWCPAGNKWSASAICLSNAVCAASDTGRGGAVPPASITRSATRLLSWCLVASSARDADELWCRTITRSRASRAAIANSKCRTCVVRAKTATAASGRRGANTSL